MSKQTIENFFPAFTKFVTTQVPYGSWVFHDILFPDATAKACPTIAISIKQLPLLSSLLSSNESEDAVTTIRQPMLLLAAIGGIIIGFYGAIRLRSVSYKWVVSYAAFGIMNISAIWIHCLLESPGEELYPEKYPMWWMLDTYMTGVAASALIVACLETSHDKALTTESEARGWDRMFWMFQGIGLTSLASFIEHYIVWIVELLELAFKSALWLLKAGKGRIPADRPNIEDMGVTEALEMWYLLCPLNAMVNAIQLLFGPIVVRDATTRSYAFFPQWKRRNGGKDSRHWTNAHTMFAISLILPTILGIGLDRFWCWAIHSRERGGTFSFFLWDLLTASTMTFMGCDLSYLAILLWLMDKQKNHWNETDSKV